MYNPCFAPQSATCIGVTLLPVSVLIQIARDVGPHPALFIVLVPPGHFTSGGHYIVLYGLNSKGQILVSDCGSRSRNGAWNFDIVFNETKDGYWQIYK